MLPQIVFKPGKRGDFSFKAVVQVLIDRSGAPVDQGLADKGPGHQLQVSGVVGQGYASLFNSYVRLLSAMEESRDLILVGVEYSCLRWSSKA